MPQAILSNPLVRLHLYAVEHARVLVPAAMVLAGIGRLLQVNPPFAIAALIFVAIAIWHSSLPQAARLSNRHLALTALMLFLVTSLVWSGIAHADGGTLGGMATSLKNDGSSVIQAVVYAFYGGGVVSTGVGINNGIKKSRGDQQVTNGHIFGYGLGGPALGMVGYVMDNAAGSMGGSASNMNTLPTSTN